MFFGVFLILVPYPLHFFIYLSISFDLVMDGRCIHPRTPLSSNHKKKQPKQIIIGNGFIIHKSKPNRCYELQMSVA